MRLPSVCIVILTLGLAACGGGNDAEAPVTGGQAAGAPNSAGARALRAEILTACNEGEAQPAGFCECYADHAAEQLSPAVVEMVIARMRDEDSRIAALAAGLSYQDQMSVANFSVAIMRDCAGTQEN